VLGVIDQPITKERWVGVQGSPSTLNGHPITTRDCGHVSNAYMYSTTPHMFEGATEQVTFPHCSGCQQQQQEEEGVAVAFVP
jgi:fructose-1,6-bisphosphatase/inositol monophosphatase family enzyme